MAWGGAGVLRDRDAALYLSGVLVSGFGSTAMGLFAGVWTKELTGSDGLAGLAAFFLWAPTLAGPLIGTLADRTRRVSLPVRLNTAMAVLLPVLLPVRSADLVRLLFAVLLVYGAASVLGDAAEAGVVAATVPGELRGDFNGLRLSANEGMKLLAPLAGAALFARFGAAPVVLADAVTFAAAAAAFALMRVREPAPVRSGEGLRERTAAGLRHLRGHPGLRRPVAVAGTVMLLSGLNGAAVYAVVDAGLGRSPAFAGVLYAAQGAGSVAAGAAAGALLRRLPERGFAAAGTVLFAAGAALRAAPWTWAAVIGSVLIGAGLPCALIAVMTAVQRETPGDLLGRAAATAGTLVLAPVTLGTPLGAALVAVADHRLLLGAVGPAGAATALWCLAPVRPAAPGGPPREGTDAPGAADGHGGTAAAGPGRPD
ncbi:MAG TPA: MFS transporter [Streptomyces sp.]|uniref:MFS transporter n=1 Tax=Streptomyces sp. TaxID=1931 RepID=UPI002D6103BE|nr:MFS transporter [Streptomyces sp.]HZG04882.1 MFS transporter [Streptomyces sp.]